MTKRRRNYPDVRISITEDVERSWDPQKFTTDEQMNFILECLLVRPMRQADVAESLSLEFGMHLSTARASTSAALLLFRQAGWIEAGRKVENSIVWSVKE